MLTQPEKQRYSRQTMLPEIGMEGQLKLKAAKVLIIGAGGLGCPVLQYLAAAGVGTIGVADFDKVEESNLQRQILYTTHDIGKYKAAVAKEKIEVLNPFIAIDAHIANVTKENVIQLLEPYDVIVDGSDNFATRYLVNDACVILNKPLVFGSIFKFEGQVSVFNYQDGPTYRCVFPELPQPDEMPNCAAIGVVATLPGIVGTLQANETIKIITGIGETLSGRLLIIDALGMRTQCFSFNSVEKNKTITHLSDYVYDCKPDDSSITLETLAQMQQSEKVQLIDVREPEEHAMFNIGGVNMPLAQLVSEDCSFDTNHAIVFYCASGMRSKVAVKILTGRGLKNILSLRDGVGHLSSM